MKQFDVPVQENGRMILPIELRRALGIRKGDRVLIEAEGDVVRLTTAALSRRRAQERFQRWTEGQDRMVDAFIEEKREEAAREDGA